MAAICYLLSLIMPRLGGPECSLVQVLLASSSSSSLPSVPREVLQLKYGTVCKTFMDQLSRHQTSNSTALLKSVSSPTPTSPSFLPSFLLCSLSPPSSW